MTTRRSLRLGAALLALALIVVACGDDAATTTIPVDGHMHGTFDVPADATVPTLAVEVLEDPKQGWNLHVTTTGFDLVPERASTAAVMGEGHMHLYVDGEKLTRLYTEWYYLGDLEPGERTIRVELSANDHRAYASDGEIIDQTVTVTVPPPGEETMAHMHEMADASGWAQAASLAVEVLEDPKAGWNLHATIDGFHVVPEKASTAAVPGEGHMHLYLDGVKMTRLYGAWHYLGELEPGEHQIRVELSANDHSPVALDGRIVEQIVTVNVAGEAAAPDRVIEVAVADGFRAERREVALGERVAIRVTLPDGGEIHVHGYDVYGSVAPGGTSDVVFTADVPGIFEVEEENSGTLLLDLVVG